MRSATGSIILHGMPGIAGAAAAALVSAALHASRGDAAAVAPPPAFGPVRPGPAEAGAPLWHCIPVAEVARAFDADQRRGLGSAAARARLAAEGPNLVPWPPRRSRLAAFAAQFQSMPVNLLAGSAVLSIASGGAADAVATLAVVGFNAVLG